MADELAKIVAASGTTSGGGPLGRQIETAMAQAVLDCALEGITDPAEIVRRKLAAREQIKRAP